MCTRYVAPADRDIAACWGGLLPAAPPWADAPTVVDAFRQPFGPFLRAGGERVVGRFGLIPAWSDTPAPKQSTYNARAETVAAKPSFRSAWARGQRCIVPALSFDEPNWETGRNVWWRFHRADGAPWGLAGLWNTWVDRDSGEVHESYTLLTINADAHPLMRRMHKPDPALPPDRQDKRSVVVVERDDVAAWLGGTPAQAQALLRLAPVERYRAEPLAAPAPARRASKPPAAPGLPFDDEA